MKDEKKNRKICKKINKLVYINDYWKTKLYGYRKVS